MSGAGVRPSADSAPVCMGLSIRNPGSRCLEGPRWKLTDPQDGEEVGRTCDQHISTLLRDAGWDRPMLIESIESEDSEEWWA